MEVIEKYGIRLVRLSETHLETLRFWRNSDDVAKYMVFQKHINSNDQMKWYKSINNLFNYYFIITNEDKYCGMVNLKDYDPLKKEAESGIFMFGKTNWSNTYSVRATYSILDFGFENLNLESVNCTILVNNKSAISFNKALGVIFSKSTNPDILLGKLFKENYYLKRDKYLKYL